MMSEEKRVIHEWFEEVWNKGHEDAIGRLFASDGVAHGLEDPQGQPLVGPSGYAPFMRTYKEIFPDIHFDVRDVIQEGERVAARCVVSGTHTGEGLGIPPTQRRIEIEGMAFVIVHGGQIQEAWNIFDFRSLMGQLTEPPPDKLPFDHT